MTPADPYDLVVIGGGPAGERAAILAARSRKKVALVEREPMVGGTRVNWGTIPSKTLRETALFVHGLTASRMDAIRAELPDEITIGDFMARERRVVRRELDLINEALDRYAVDIVHGYGRLLDVRTVEVRSGRTGDGDVIRRLTAPVLIIATGSSPNHPPDVPFDGDTVFDSASILALPRMPRSLVVLGAGVIGIEYASIFAALGLTVTLIDTRARLLPYLDHEIVDRLEAELVRHGITVVHGDHYRVIERVPGDVPRVRCETRHGAVHEADALLYCVGRDGNSHDLGLESIGVVPNARGLIDVNEYYQTLVPHVYAVGDVIGYPALASTSMEQGRQAVRHAFGIPGPMGRTGQLPFAIYAHPEVSYIGPTEEQLKNDGIPYVAGRARYELNPRGQIVGATGGLLKLLFHAETLKLLGVHIVGQNASELVHIGQAFLACAADAKSIAETLFNYPTLSDMYRHAALTAYLQHRTPASDVDERH